MLSNISWTDYIATVAILAALYYSYVGIRYYSAELKDLISGKRKINHNAEQYANEDHFYAEQISNDPDESGEEIPSGGFKEVEGLIEQLKTVIADASGKEVVVEELTTYLHLVFQEYPSLKNSPLRSSVNELVVSECEKYGAVSLSEREVDELW